MPFSQSEKLAIAQKLSLQITSVSDSKFWYNELFSNLPIVDPQNILSELGSIPGASSLSQAQTNVTNNPTLIEELTIRLTVDLTSNYQAYVATTTFEDFDTRLQNSLSPALIMSGGAPSYGYSVRLYDGDPDSGGTELFTSYLSGGGGEPSWAFSYGGILFVSGDVASSFQTLYDTNGLYIKVFHYIGSTGGTGGSTIDPINGSMFIHSLVPDTGNINVTMVENDTRIESAVASPDVTQITVGVFAYTGNTNVRPVGTINGNNISWITPPEQNPVAYYGTYELTMNNGEITATHEDGATHTISIVGDPKPIISSAIFINGYPGSQSELKAGDTFDVQVQSDIDFVRIEVEDIYAGTGQIVNIAPTSDTTFACYIANRGGSTQDLPVKIRVQKSTGTWSDWIHTNEGFTTVDGTNLVKLNNTYPSIETMNQSSIIYPVLQEAIKDAEIVTVHSTCSGYTTIEYSSPNGELTIPDTTTYSENKSNIARNSGTYNVTNNNYRIVANRSYNDATTTRNLVVYIAHADPTITMTEPNYLRSGGSNGSSVQSHTITLTSNQRLISLPIVDNPPVGAGSWSGVFTSSNDIVWTRSLLVDDSDTKGAYSYGSLSATNLANKVVSTYTGDSNYILRGFVPRTIPLSAFANEVSMLVEAITYTNVVMTWSFKSLPNRRSVGTTATPDQDSWCLNTLATNPTIIRILDTSATGSSSQESFITIEEVV